MPIRVILVDDHAVVRSGLRRVLEAGSDIEVVGEASNVATPSSRCAHRSPT